VQPRDPLPCEPLAHVGTQVARDRPRLLERARADRKITDQLDEDMAATPHALDHAHRHIATNSEVRVQTMAARMPLRHPQIRDRPPAELAPQPPEELAQLDPQPHWIEAALAGIGQRAKPVQPIRRAEAPNHRPCPTRRLLLRALRIDLSITARSPPRQRRHKATTALRRLRIERERPKCLMP